MIEKQLNGTNKWFKVATLESSTMHYCVENLKEKSEYFFKICAENCIGLSEPVETKLVSLLTHASKYCSLCAICVFTQMNTFTLPCGKQTKNLILRLLTSSYFMLTNFLLFFIFVFIAQRRGQLLVFLLRLSIKF